MTVRSGRFELKRRLEAVWSLGFAEAGVAPLRVTADHSELSDDRWPAYRDQLIDVAREELARAEARPANSADQFRDSAQADPCRREFTLSMRRRRRLFSIAPADGDWYACHRAIGDARYRLGSPSALDADRRRSFLAERHVHAKVDCRLCWARYLCSGGCHQEAEARTEASCDFIRDWLDFCLASYCELSSRAASALCPSIVVGSRIMRTGTVPQTDRAKRSREVRPFCRCFGASPRRRRETRSRRGWSQRSATAFPGWNATCAISSGVSFLFLEVDIGDDQITLVGVDTDGVARAAASRRALAAKGRDLLDAGRMSWRQGVPVFISRLSGTFGVLGSLDLDSRVSQHRGRLPAIERRSGRETPDAWTAVRLLTRRNRRHAVPS